MSYFPCFPPFDRSQFELWGCLFSYSSISLCGELRGLWMLCMDQPAVCNSFACVKMPWRSPFPSPFIDRDHQIMCFKTPPDPVIKTTSQSSPSPLSFYTAHQCSLVLYIPHTMVCHPNDKKSGLYAVGKKRLFYAQKAWRSWRFWQCMHYQGSKRNVVHPFFPITPLFSL
jgi:hypothetical protein